MKKVWTISLKILAVPAMMGMGILWMAGKVIGEIGSRVLGIFLLFLTCCVIFTIKQANWDGLAVLLMTLAGTFLLVLTAGILSVLLEKGIHRLADFLR